MVLSLWTMTILNLYVRVQVNILGRHLYIGTARDLGSSNVLVRSCFPVIVNVLYYSLQRFSFHGKCFMFCMYIGYCLLHLHNMTCFMILENTTRNWIF